MNSIGRSLTAAHLPTLEFAAFPRISLRDAPRGGPVGSQSRVTPADLLLGSDELLLLIHGYNNSEPDAFASYRTFLMNVGDPWVARSGGVFWPGDASDARPGRRPGLLFPLLAAASYPWQPHRAAQAAQHIADLIATALVSRSAVAERRGRQADALTLNVVAHSMGCRLALELIKLLRPLLLAGAALRIRSLVLLAAAVPHYHVGDRGPLEAALTTADSTLILWSRRDRVLRFAFPLGQLLERPFPLGWHRSARGALGRSGSATTPRLQSEETRLDHSDYWPDRKLAGRVRTVLDGPKPSSRQVTRDLSVRRIAPRVITPRRHGDRVTN